MRKRFLSKVQKKGSHWLWTAYVEKTGYGLFWNGKRMEWAHRVSYQLFVGKIPKGRDIHHTCEIRHCVNPSHLVALTRKQHANGHPNNITTANLKKTRCKHGHKFTPENTRLVFRDGRYIGRDCRACNRARYHNKKVLNG